MTKDLLNLLNARSPSDIANAFLLLKRNTMDNVNKKSDGRKTICIILDLALLDILSVLRTFYGYETRNKLMPFLVMNAVLEVAALKVDPAWTKNQLKAHSDCLKFALDFNRAFIRIVWISLQQNPSLK